MIVAVLILAGLLVLDLAWEHVQSRARDLDAEERHAALIRELRRHDPDRRLSARRR